MGSHRSSLDGAFFEPTLSRGARLGLEIIAGVGIGLVVAIVLLMRFARRGR